jgi:hypothetical protein
VLLSKKFSDVGLPPMTSNAESAFPVLAGNDTVLSVPPDSSLFSIRRSLHFGPVGVVRGVLAFASTATAVVSFVASMATKFGDLIGIAPRPSR